MTISKSARIIATPSAYARENYLYVQETGTLQSIEPHLSKRENLASFLFFIVIKGSGSLFYRKQTYPIHTGDCIFIDCLEEYAHKSSKDDPWELSWVHFHGKNADAFYKNYIEQGNPFLFHPADLSLFLDSLSILYMTQKEQTPYMELLCHKYITDLITLCFMECEKQKNTTSQSIYEKIRQVTQFIDVHFQEDITLDGLSQKFYISKFHLAREFKRITGSTPGDYLLGKRISNAKKLLRFTNASIEEIGRSCGILEAGYFTKVFKKAEGMTPREYRRKW
ncbi:MAG: AraC family transcriptional regulator [Roseburia sp.]|nr:AraC family transcriptional regulator [Roseburia sp.]MCM1278102.1 AraC family transcriptional regulator [Robinsoniella sp.]